MIRANARSSRFRDRSVAKIRQTNIISARASENYARGNSHRSLEASRGLPSHSYNPASNKAELLEPIRARVRACTKCAHLRLFAYTNRIRRGNPDADLMFISARPGIDEDKQQISVRISHAEYGLCTRTGEMRAFRTSANTRAYRLE